MSRQMNGLERYVHAQLGLIALDDASSYYRSPIYILFIGRLTIFIRRRMTFHSAPATET